MRKQAFFLLISFMVSASVAAQSHTETLMAYQDKYKKDLFPIIGSDTAFVKFYPLDSTYRVIAKVEKLVTQSFFPMPTSDKSSKKAIKYASVKFTLQGKEYTLSAYQMADLMENSEYKNYVLVPFMDATTGTDTYIGGRYIDFAIPDITKDNKLVLDFNKAYNPYCAFKKGFSCPIPPEENKLPVKIITGEMDFSK